MKVVASYCVTFLMPEMLHVYRQISGFQSFRPLVLTQKWIHRDRFPVDCPVQVLPKSRLRALRRLWFKQIRRAPVTVSRRQTRAILHALDRGGASLLHVYFGHIGVYLLPVLRQTPLPVVVSFHGADAGVDAAKPAHRRALEEVFHLADRILVRSEALGAELRALGCPADKIVLNRTGIPLEEWPFTERHPPAGGEWRLLQACRFMEKKGLDTTLHAFASLHARFPRARLTLAGEGPLLEPVRALAAELGVRDFVEFPGFLDQPALRELMQRSHLFLHPSRTSADGNQEGVPNSMLEAMATGLPVVATRHGGIPEAVTHGVSGLLVEENDAPGLATALERLCRDPALLASTSRAARQAVENGFDRRARIAALERIYAELTG